MVWRSLCLLFYFFFQAEDGIRDYKVTGVQTCALPIYGKRGKPEAGFPLFPQPLGNLAKGRRDSHIPTAPTTKVFASEESKKRGGRRVAALRATPPNDVYQFGNIP